MASGTAEAADQGAPQRAQRQLVVVEMLQEIEPDRRHTEADRHPLGLEQLIETLAVELRAPAMTSFAPVSAVLYGVPQALTWNIGTIGQTVALIAMPIPSPRQTPRLCSTVERLREQRAFRVARRAGRIAERGRGILVERRPSVIGRVSAAISSS